ncbi:single-stranded DNA-binding protein [Streptomyces sp. PmtG]
MNDTLVTVVGNVATTPVFRETPSGAVTRFRIAVTPRHFDRARNEWADGHTNFFTVWARRTLGVNVQSSVALGEQVIVQGRLKVRDEERGGQHWLSVDIDAFAIGHDLSRGTSAFRRAKRPGQLPAERPPTGQGEPAWESATPLGEPGEPGGPGEPGEGDAAETPAAPRETAAAETESVPEPAGVA